MILKKKKSTDYLFNFWSLTVLNYETGLFYPLLAGFIYFFILKQNFLNVSENQKTI